MQLLEKLTSVLGQGADFITDGQLLKNKIVESALKNDPVLLSLLATDEKLKSIFFKDIGSGLVVFDKDRLIKFVSSKEFLPDSYTAFKNKVGLSSNGEYLKADKNVVLVWPYKDCVLEGGQSREDSKSNEVFWNETLAPDETELLLKPKTFTNFKRLETREIERETDRDTQVVETTDFELQLTDNLIIKGNNLLALHSLKERFKGQIKLIYIDPPYNTGNDGFGYNDSFNQATWLTFMKNRLEIARELLHFSGSIFISIDNNEIGNLNALMDEVFGIENRKNLITVKRSSVSGAKVINSGLVNVSEFILVYSKDSKLWDVNKIFRKKERDDRYGSYIINFEEPAEQWRFCSVLEAFANSVNIEKSKLKKYFADEYQTKLESFYMENSKRIIRFASIDEKASSNDVVEVKKESLLQTNKTFIYKREKFSDYYIHKGQVILFFEDRLIEIDGEKVFAELIHDIWDDVLPNDLHNEGGVSFKKGKKPERLLQRIIDLTTKPGDIVLDYHLGSGTTAAVAHKMGRQYIGIEQMNYIETIAIERLKGVLGGEQGGISKAVNWQGGGSFVYCELMGLNSKYIDEIETANSAKQLNMIMQNILSDGYITYKIDPNVFRAEFENLNAIEDKKRVLIDILDKNYLYVNYSEIDDVANEVSEQDKAFNMQFYGVEK